ncbi:MAG: hydrogenase maturation nickel metallochaperone HypA [bacterium]|jgi:hydrogenase nickel incorporation protein HypA/HybF|nr:hydrogenase maturation nickel metallochaperone HypA [bacterium]
MHELSIVQNIIGIIQSELSKHNITRVKSISLRIGRMRQVVPDALFFAFECLSKDTPLEGAEVKIEDIPIKGRCRNCHHEFILENWQENCASCGENQMDIISGKELEIAEFEGT